MTVSIPQALWEQLVTFAREHGVPPDEIISDALCAYMHRRSDSDDVTEAMNRAIAELGQPGGAFVQEASRLTLKNVEW